MAASPVRSALFVDFDNVFGSLFHFSPNAANAFGTRPDTWLGFFEAGLHAAGDPATANLLPRAVLSRRCYLNPDGYIDPARENGRDGWEAAKAARIGNAEPVQFRRFRNFFTRAGFTVVDCPRLTRGTKNSADIVMVMDIIDALEHPTRYDEFIILSADADFTPVLLRLREHDRRTAVFANRQAAAAYRAASDILIGEHDFMERALGLGTMRPVDARKGAAKQGDVGQGDISRGDVGQTDIGQADTGPDATRPVAGAVPDSAAGLDGDMVGTVARAVAEHVHANGPMSINEASSVFHQFPAFRQRTSGRWWLGYGTKARLFEEIARREPTLVLDQTQPYEWTIGPANAGARAMDLVRQVLANSPRPILLSQLGNQVKRQIAGLPARGWPDATSFRAFLTAAEDPHVAVLSEGTGYAYDPSRHDPRDVATTVPPVDAGPTAPGLGAGEISAPDGTPTEPHEADGHGLDEAPLAELSPAEPDSPEPPCDAALRARMLSNIQGVLANENEPMELGDLERIVRAAHPAVDEWPGGGTLAQFLRAADDPRLAVLPVGRGFVYDPERHDPLAMEAAGQGHLPAPLRAVLNVVSKVTECPRLLPEQHRTLFAAVAAELGGGAFDMSSEWGLQALAAAVEQHCERQGTPIARPVITYVLTSLDDYADWPQAIDAATPHQMANTYCACIAALCADNRVELNEAELTLLRCWIGVEAATRNLPAEPDPASDG